MMDRLADPERLRSLLDRLEQNWCDAGSHLSEWLLPGLSEDEIRDWFALEGLVPPAEAIVWWGWHSESDPSLGYMYSLPPVYFRFVSIQQALDIHRWLAEIEEYPGYASLLPIVTGDAHEVAIHLDVPPGHRSPVREIVYEEAEAADYIVADSLEQLVERWVTILDLGLCKFDDESASMPDWPAIRAFYGKGLTSAFGIQVLSPLRHDPPPLSID